MRLLALTIATLLALPALALAGEPGSLEGGFRFRDEEGRRDAAVLSLGPLVLGGVRDRLSLDDDGTIVCQDVVFTLLGAKGTKRSGDRVRLEQKSDVVVFFVFAECDENLDEQCLLGASAPVAVDGCSARMKLDASAGIDGSVKLKCKDGVDASAGGFGLSPREVGWVQATFPELGDKFKLKFRDKTGEEVTGDNLAFKVQNLDVDALDDPVTTYLADDGLPACDR